MNGHRPKKYKMKNLLDTNTVLNILYLEDSQQDLEIIQELLIDAGYKVSIDHVENEKEFVSSLLRQKFDIILSDFNLPSYDAFSALRKSIEICPEVPFIVVSGTIGEETAIELIKLGADDYILKDKPERLPYAINRALEEAIAKKALKLSEKELRKSEIMYRTLTENIPDIVARFDTNLRHIYVNSAIEKIVGIPPHSFIGKTNEELGMPMEQVSIWNEQLLHVFKTAKQRKIEFSFLTSGGIRYFSSLAVPEFSKDGKVVSVLSVAHDITERKKSEVELIKAKEKAEESDNLKTAFLHNISHEIRTPMNAIVGFSGFLNDPDLLSEQRQNFTDIIVQSSNQLLAIITDIISVATIEAGQAKINEKETNLNTICKLLNEQYQLKAQEQNVFLSLKTNLPDHDALVITDEIKLTEILANLIGNALKFTQKGTIEFGYSLEQNALKFYVEDTGIGIPPELIGEIFTRFRQVETTSSRQFGGSGLGLSISKAYVELLGGQMWVTSELNKGSVFYFTIPYKNKNTMYCL